MAGANEREVKRRINSVENTKQITRAMKMVSTAKVRRSEESVNQGKPYFETLDRMMRDLSQHLDDSTHRLLNTPASESDRKLLFLVTADKGLCGSFNSNLVKKARGFVNEQQEKGFEIDLVTAGKKGKSAFEGSRLRPGSPDADIIQHYDWFQDQPEFEQVRPMAEYLHSQYLSGKYRSVHMIYARFINIMKNIPTLIQLLPITGRAEFGAEDGEDEGESEDRELSGEMLLEPSGEEMLDTLLPRYYRVTVFRAVQENFTSEHGSRMVAMDNATENAEEMIEELTLKFNKARQQSITREILDIVGGAEAMKQG